MTTSLDDQKKLNKVVSSLDVSSPGQLVRMLISGEEKRIDWICVELTYEGLMHEVELSAVVKRIFTKRVNTIQSLIEDAQRQKEIPKDVDTESLADLIIGLERVVILRWRLENYNFSLKEHTLTALKMLLDVFKVK